MRVDELDDALDVFGNRCCCEVEELRARDGDMSERLVDLEKLQPVRCELLAQLRRQLQWKIFLLLPFGADELLQSTAAQGTARHTGNHERFGGFDDRLLVRGAKMFLHFLEARELQ